MKNNYLILLFVICLIFFLPFLIKPDFLTTKDNDLGRTYVPLFTFVKNSFYSQKSIPLWRPDQLMGETFIGNPLSSLFYPVNVLFLIFPVKFASVIYFFLHFILAGISTYFLARSFKFSKVSSFAAAIFYSFSTKMLLHLSAGHITMIAAFSYFPLIVLAARKILEKPKFNWIVAGALGFSLSFITYPTIFYYSVIFTLSYLSYRLIHLWVFKKHQIVYLFRKLIPFMVIFLMTFGLSAIVIFPQIEFSKFSTRPDLNLKDVAIPLWNFKKFLGSLLFPYFNFKSFDQESFLYLGAVPTILSVIGFVHLSKFRKITLLIFGLLTLTFVAGLSTPIFPLIYKFVPFVTYTRVTTRLWFTVALIVALLSAFALEKFKNKSIIYFIIVIFLVESFFIGYKKIFFVPNLLNNNESLHQDIAKDKDIFRVYCTTYCFNPQLVSKYNIQVLHGETPIQHKSFIDFLQKAGGYTYADFAVIFPPYQIWQIENLPFPNAKILGEVNVKYIASTHQIEKDDFIFQNKYGDVYLYKNNMFQTRFFFEGSSQEVKLEKYSPNSIILK